MSKLRVCSSLFCLLLILSSLGESLGATSTKSLNYMNQELSFNAPAIIYGRDDRYEANSYFDDNFVKKAHSVAMRVANKHLSESREDPNIINFLNKKLKQTMPQLCPTEKYLEQTILGDCTGFLVSPTTLVTAGHCMKSENECLNNKWVFDYNEDTKDLKKNDVYACKKIISQKEIYSKNEVSDYAVIQLDRPVFDRAPLERRKFGQVPYGTPLLVIGHPLGLPMKITDGAEVMPMNDIELKTRFRSLFLRDHYFTANLDSYAGNSGSPVFNVDTGKVEGVLIQGADDFVFDEKESCIKSRHLRNNYHHTYEKVMKITEIPGL